MRRSMSIILAATLSFSLLSLFLCHPPGEAAEVRRISKEDLKLLLNGIPARPSLMSGRRVPGANLTKRSRAQVPQICNLRFKVVCCLHSGFV